MSALDRMAGVYATNNHLNYPQDFVGAQFNRVEPSNFLQTDYLFATPGSISTNAADSFRASDWHASRIQKFPEKLEFADTVRDWAEQKWPAFKAAFREAQ